MSESAPLPHTPSLNKPKATLCRNETDIIFRQDNENHTLTEEGYYNVTSTLKYYNLTQDFVYICELVIPGTPFNVTQKLMHTEGNYCVLLLCIG